MQIGKDVEVCDPEDDPRFRQYWETYHQLMKRARRHARGGQGGCAPLQHPHRLADGASWAMPTP